MKNKIRLILFLCGVLMVLETNGNIFPAHGPGSRGNISGYSDISTDGPDTLNYVTDIASISDEILITHTGYSISYNCRFKIANWVAYELTSVETTPKVKRKNNFMADPLLDTCRVFPADYAGSGFDKGHLAPCADMCWSKQTMAESFYMTNMAPQKPTFNRGIWKRLEDKARDWAIENQAVQIISGPVLTNNYQTIGKNKVIIPKSFFKVVVDITGDEIKGIAFIIPNKRSGSDLESFAVSIDSVEKLTGLDFFYQLPENVESLIESSYDLKAWSWKGKPLSGSEDD